MISSFCFNYVFFPSQICPPDMTDSVGQSSAGDIKHIMGCGESNLPLADKSTDAEKSLNQDN